MKNKLFLFLSFALLSVVTIGCTGNSRAKRYGGTYTINLKPGQKLEAITWKDESTIWYLTRPMRANELPEEHRFHEDSKLGIVEGTVVIVESK